MKSDRRTSQGRGQLVLTERDERLLDFVARFRLISRDQAMALAPFASLTRANTRLAALAGAQLLSRKVLPVYPGKGSAQHLYFLGSASTAVLSLTPQTLTSLIRQVSRWETRQTSHVLAANQVLVDFIAGVGQNPDAQLLAFKTDVELREAFQGQAFVPDGWVAWVQVGKRFNGFVELDLSTETLKVWERKLDNYQAYSDSGMHRKLFGFLAYRVLVVAKSQQRIAHLQQITRNAGRMFVFAEASGLNAKNILDSVWLGATQEERIRLKEA